MGSPFERGVNAKQVCGEPGETGAKPCDICVARAHRRVPDARSLECAGAGVPGSDDGEGVSVTQNSVDFELLLDSLKDVMVFCDTQHVIRYMNKAARLRYEGTAARVGASIFDCHNAQSNAQIVEVTQRLAAGEDEIKITEKPERSVYMRAVRDADDVFIGYYERYDPPR